MTYMYEEDEEILNYSCNQTNMVFQGILKVNDEIIRDFKNNNIDYYTDIVRERFSEYIGRR